MTQRKPSNVWALYTFLSSRLNQGRGFGSFVKGTAVLGILVGATALWITLSVVRGFSTVISEKTVEFAPELTISLASGEMFTRWTFTPPMAGHGRPAPNPSGAAAWCRRPLTSLTHSLWVHDRPPHSCGGRCTKSCTRGG